MTDEREKVANELARILGGEECPYAYEEVIQVADWHLAKVADLKQQLEEARAMLVHAR